jgi:hypothetical protein
MRSYLEAIEMIIYPMKPGMRLGCQIIKACATAVFVGVVFAGFILSLIMQTGCL